MSFGLKTDVAANMLGNVWTSVLALVLVPLYIRFLGMEAYGLIGVYAVLFGIMSLFDLGLSPALNREVARLSAVDGMGCRIRDSVRTVELIYWAITLIACTLLVLLAPVVAGSWLKQDHIPVMEVRNAIYLMCVSVVFQLPLNFYSAAMLGLQRQVTLNLINAVMLTVRGGGAVGVLCVSPTIGSFFAWQAVSSAIHVAWVAVSLWICLPSTGVRASFDTKRLGELRSFAGACAVSAVLQTIIANMDKIILSATLSLEVFGYYSLASLAANTLMRFASPISTAIFPRFTQMIARDDVSRLTQLYHRSCQAIAILTLPLLAMLLFFSEDVLWVWTGNRLVAEQSHYLVMILAVGAAMANMVTMPGLVSVAFGWMTPTLVAQGVGVVVMLPLMFCATRLLGAMGAAGVWSSWHICVALLWPLFLHRKIMRGELAAWYVKDMLFPVSAALVTGGLLRLVFLEFPALTMPGRIVPSLLLAGVMVFLGTLAVVKDLQLSILDWRRAWN